VEALHQLIDTHGFYSVLNAYANYMMSKITPQVIGFELVWPKLKEISNIARYLDNTKSEWSK
jgi:hypothetical protein